MRFSHLTLARLVGGSWLLIGLFLFLMGFVRLGAALEAMRSGNIVGHAPAAWLTSLVGSASSMVVILVLAGLGLGWMKQRLVLNKTINRALKRIQGLPERARFSQVYGWPYLLLIVLMMGLGMLMRVLGVPDEIRAVVLVAVGSGLMRGSLVAFSGGKASPA